ncbi:MAG: response regulator transcription factor, partial [Hyphomonadaceae bacterium]
MKSARSIYVLLVDDNRQMRVLVRELLRALGMRHCAEAGNAAEGVTMMRTFPADLVITDLAMGDEDGLAFARRIR